MLLLAVLMQRWGWRQGGSQREGQRERTGQDRTEVGRWVGRWVGREEGREREREREREGEGERQSRLKRCFRILTFRSYCGNPFEAATSSAATRLIKSTSPDGDGIGMPFPDGSGERMGCRKREAFIDADEVAAVLSKMACLNAAVSAILAALVS